MRHGILKVCFFMLAAVLAGCGNDKAEGISSSVQFEGYEYDCILELPDSLALEGEGGRYVRVSGQGVLPVVISGEQTESVRDSLMRLGGVAEIDRSSVLPIVTPGYKMTSLDPLKDAACSTRYNQLTVTLVTPRLVVWRDYAYGYLCHSAHGMYTTTYINYSIPQKKIITLSDLFKAGYEKGLTDLLREKLKDEEVPLSVPLEEVGIPGDFEITENGVRFVYPLYEIAPYVEGEVMVDIAGYELSDLLREGVEDMYWSSPE